MDMGVFVVSRLDFTNHLDWFLDAGLGGSAGLESICWAGLSWSHSTGSRSTDLAHRPAKVYNS